MRKYFFIFVLVSSFLLFLTACGESTVSNEPVVGEGESSESQAVATDEGVVETPSVESGDQGQTEVDNEIVETDQVVNTEEVSDACVDCHSDRASLTTTAKPEEDLESESEGEG